MKGKLERCDGLDGLRVLAMFGILVMHVLANVGYQSELSHLYKYIVKFGDFTALFMMVSAFSVSCGYYERIKNGGYSEIENFYKKRYKKILPFFLALTVVDVVLSPSLNSIFEGIANATLVFGFIPHENITVIGVGWTLGVIFAFYLLYPFFVFCMQSKKRFIIMFTVALFFAFASNSYFDLGKVDFLYCSLYFVTGCGLYLFRDKVKAINRWVLFVLTIFTGGFFFCVGSMHSISKYIFISLLVMYAIATSSKKTVFSNRFMKFLNGYSFEIYLCHMVSYRFLEEIRALRLFDNALLSYCFVCIAVLLVSFIIAYVFKLIETKMVKII